jgi:soluble lytic murein transglycosylase-like protein
MPGTADDWKLADPFDPAEAIPKAAELLASLRQRFGNLGLAAAAYNAGPNRVANWIAGHGDLPSETRSYVLNITQHPVEDWNAPDAGSHFNDGAPSRSCLELAASIRKGEPTRFAGSVLTAPWGVQLSGSFSKSAALAAYDRAAIKLRNLIGDVEPMILGGRAPDRGFAPFYRVRVPASSRAEANALCNKILRAGGACAVLRS